MAEPIEMPFGFRTWVGAGNHVLDGGQDTPIGRGDFRWKKSHCKYRHCEYRDFLPWAVQERLNWSICRLDCGLGWAGDAQVQSCSPGGINVPTWEGTLAPPGEYNWTIRLRRWCGLMSNYFDHLLLLLDRIAHTTYIDVVYFYRPSSVVCLSVCLSH